MIHDLLKSSISTTMTMVRFSHTKDLRHPLSSPSRSGFQKPTLLCGKCVIVFGVGFNDRVCHVFLLCFVGLRLRGVSSRPLA
jgi:hypothetical protein